MALVVMSGTTCFVRCTRERERASSKERTTEKERERDKEGKGKLNKHEDTTFLILTLPAHFG